MKIKAKTSETPGGYTTCGHVYKNETQTTLIKLLSNKSQYAKTDKNNLQKNCEKKFSSDT